MKWGLITDQSTSYQPVNYQPEKVETRVSADKDMGEEKSEVE